MKKFLVICGVLCLLLTGCGPKAEYNMEEYIWQMTTVQSLDANGQIIACGPGEKELYGTATELDLICTVEDESLNLKDRYSGQSWEGICRPMESTSESVIYQTSINGWEGMSIVSSTTYDNGTEKPTLILNIGDYILTFFPSEY